MDEKYIKDAALLIKHAKSNLKKDIIPKTILPNQVGKPILPSFSQIQDGFKNLISGLGGSQHKSTYTTYRTSFCMTDQLLYSLYLSHGLSRKISSALPKDATKNDIIIESDTDNVLKNKWDNLFTLKAFKQADFFRRHFGGSLIYIDIDDGKDLEDPVNLNTINSINGLKVYCRTDVFFTNIHFNEDIRSPNYGKPEYYTIIPKYTTPFNIHYSRVLEFLGEEVPAHLDNGYRYYWGQSVLEPLWESLKKTGASIENLDQLLYEMTISIYKIKGLADMIANGEFNKIKNIIDNVDQAKSAIRSLLIDMEGHDYTRDSLNNFSGVKDVIELLFTLLSAESDIPMMRLFGQQKGALNNEGKGELALYYDQVQTHQKENLTPQAQQLVNLINVSKEIGNKKVKDPIVKFNSPYQLTQKEELENRKIQSEIDDRYTKMGSMSNQEVRELRCVNDYSYSMNVSELESYQENIFEEPMEEEDIEELEEI